MPDWFLLVSNLFQIAGSASLVVSVLLLLREIRENNRLTRAANVQALVSLSGPFYMALVQDRQLAELCARGIKGAEFDEVDRQRYHHLLICWLTFYENIFYQRRQGLLEPHAFEPWRRELEMFLRRQRVAAHWNDIKDLFQTEFAAYVVAVLQGDAATARAGAGL
ncbi:MAG TPA: hypothetical protein VMS17_14785 [Gemmataceae bacterium]|nr:hypothetical protein [Gemmataceae bacterium]